MTTLDEWDCLDATERAEQYRNIPYPTIQILASQNP